MALDDEIAAITRGSPRPRAALYLRVSTDGQTTKNQRMALERVAEARGWDVVAVYEDAGISGAKDRAGRPGLDRALSEAKGKFDILMAWSLDRLGRSLIGLLDTLAELDTAGVALFLDQQAIDTTTPAGRMFFQVIGAFAEFERSMIRSRVMAGLDRAVASGKRLGRRVETDDGLIAQLLRDGRSMDWVRREAGCGMSAVQRVKAALS